MTFHTTDGLRPDAPLTWRGRPIPLTRKAIGDEIERLMELLDCIDGDPDEEPAGDELDTAAPWGWPECRPLLHEDSEEDCRDLPATREAGL